MDKLLTFLSIVFLCGCSGIYDEDEMAIAQKHISVTIEDISHYGHVDAVKIRSSIQWGMNLNILQRGHCYAIDSYVVPDTTSFKTLSPTQQYEPTVFYSDISYQNTDRFIIVRGFITFADSIIYSPGIIIYLNQYGD
jgi:hypothetical protein